MRRQDRKQTSQQFLDGVLDDGQTVFVAFEDAGAPYCLPFNFARIDKSLYFHSAHEGKKLDLLRKHSETGFSVATDAEIDQQRATTYYRCVAGKGVARIVEDNTEKRAALDALTVKYQARCERPAPDAMLARVTIWAIDITEITGKANFPHSS